MMHGCDCVYRVEGIAESFPSYAGARKFARGKDITSGITRDTSACACRCENCEENRVLMFLPARSED